MPYKLKPPVPPLTPFNEAGVTGDLSIRSKTKAAVADVAPKTATRPAVSPSVADLPEQND
jgi:hypothetical protein